MVKYTHNQCHLTLMLPRVKTAGKNGDLLECDLDRSRQGVGTNIFRMAPRHHVESLCVEDIEGIIPDNTMIVVGHIDIHKNIHYGTPVDIFDAAETGALSRIAGDVATLYDVMFIICLDQVKEHFDVQKFDEANRKTYEMFPEQAAEPVLTKASRWFSSLTDGDAFVGMVKAFEEAVVNFIPNENRKAAMWTILEKERETARIESEYRVKAVEMMFEQTKADLGKRWENFSAQEALKLLEELDGQFGSSGSTLARAE